MIFIDGHPNNEQLLFITKKENNRDMNFYNELLHFFSITLSSSTMNCE
jgi:hypothetical protein